jgi:hypothetical protein
MKWERSKEIKIELFTKGEVPILMHSLEVWEHPRVHTLKRMHSDGNLPYNK